MSESVVIKWYLWVQSDPQLHSGHLCVFPSSSSISLLPAHIGPVFSVSLRLLSSGLPELVNLYGDMKLLN